MEKKEIEGNSNYDDKDNKLSHDPLIRQIDDHTFEIRINLELRKHGICKIRQTERRLSILDIDENIVISVTNYKDIHGLYNRLEDQLANDYPDLSYQFLDALWHFLNQAKPSLGRIVHFFQNQDLRGDYI